MKIRILYRQIQEIPAENREKQKELEHSSDLAALRLGIPLPTRYRPFTGNMNSRMRIHEREYESIADFTRLHGNGGKYYMWMMPATLRYHGCRWRQSRDGQ